MLVVLRPSVYARDELQGGLFINSFLWEIEGNMNCIESRNERPFTRVQHSICHMCGFCSISVYYEL